MFVFQEEKREIGGRVQLNQFERKRKVVPVSVDVGTPPSLVQGRRFPQEGWRWQQKWGWGPTLDRKAPCDQVAAGPEASLAECEGEAPRTRDARGERRCETLHALP